MSLLRWHEENVVMLIGHPIDNGRIFGDEIR